MPGWLSSDLRVHRRPSRTVDRVAMLRAAVLQIEAFYRIIVEERMSRKAHDECYSTTQIRLVPCSR